MKQLLIAILFTTLYACSEKKIASEVLQINYGTSFGMCRSYCIHEVKINRNWTVKIERTWADSLRYPTTYDSTKTDASMWSYLLERLNQSNFATLPERIGCPDCADGGAEWLEVVKTNGAHQKSTFEYGADMKDLNPLLDAFSPQRKSNRGAN